jgi:hypothetical protein
MGCLFNKKSARRRVQSADFITTCDTIVKSTRKRLVYYNPYRKDHRMPTPNYKYEKRQKELAKKKKNEEKLKRKQEKKPDEPIVAVEQTKEKEKEEPAPEQG